MTYKELVNSVLVRLREEQIVNVTDNSYSTLIGEFVNDAKRQVEDAWNWTALRQTLTVTTTANTFNYEMNGAGTRFRVLDVINDTSNIFMYQESSSWFNERFLNTQSAVKTGEPRNYTFNGVSSDGDIQVDVYPIPDAVYALRFNFVIPQAKLTDNETVLLVPSEPVILGAYARAVAERGEDGGLSTAEATALAANSLNDAIAIEANHFPSELVWNEV
jgi:hypothetical protein